MKVVAITQARCGSTRFPDKILKKINGQSLLEIHVKRILQSKKLDQLIIATTTNPNDAQIGAVAKDLGVQVTFGSEDDVLDRFYQAAKGQEIDYVVRLTSDCPLIDPQLLDEVIQLAIDNESDYASNVMPPVFPDGQDIEVFKFSALEQAWREAKLPSDREHVTPFIRNNSECNGGHLFKAHALGGAFNYEHIRMTVDEPVDLEVIKALIEAVGTDKDWLTYTNYLVDNPDIQANAHIIRNEGAITSSKKNKQMITDRYKKSTTFIREVEKYIPLASQTFSKSKTQYPVGVSPLFADRAEGAYLWDIDGNKYIDCVNSLLAISLGYNDPDVKAAVVDQLEKGTIFTLPHELEYKVAKKICEMVPCAEMVRFGKNGSDATAGAIRIARAYTQREHVLVCGYHGWQDWYIGSTTRDMGVPQGTQELTHKFAYNDIESLKIQFEKLKGKVACVILEPMNVFFPQDGFLEQVKEITHANGAILIFDETITGFRYANGGAQELFNVTPDLATFGKGLANGYPVSVVTGKAKYMKLMEDIFFSFTFGGDTMSLAASYAVLNKLENEPVIKTIEKYGQMLIDGLDDLIKKYQLEDIFSVEGHPAWSFFIIKDTPDYSAWEIKTLYLQEMFLEGILTIGTHNVSYSHREKEVRLILDAYDKFLKKFKHISEKKNLQDYLHCDPLEPLFKVR